MEQERKITFLLRVLHNQIKLAIHNSAPPHKIGPKSQLQGGILGYLYHHGEEPVYQRDLEKEFRISRATATNTLQVMERDGLIVRKALDKDARLKRIQMTEEAYRGHMQMEAHMKMMDRKLLGGLTESEVAELYRLLGVLLKNLEGFVSQWNQEESPPEKEERCGGEESPPEEEERCGGEESPPEEEERCGGEKKPPDAGNGFA